VQLLLLMTTGRWLIGTDREAGALSNLSWALPCCRQTVAKLRPTGADNANADAASISFRSEPN
jgi:hypothetical protein